MTARLSPLARRRTPLRESVYGLLVRQPTRSWTVAALCGELDGGSRTCRDRVRAVLYVLLADDALTTVRGHSAFTVALNEQGETALRTLLAGWGGCPSRHLRPVLS
jgi:hypothetical protein